MPAYGALSDTVDTAKEVIAAEIASVVRIFNFAFFLMKSRTRDRHRAAVRTP